MKTARDVSCLFRRYWLQILRNPIWLAGSLLSPILYLALFTPLLQRVGGPGDALDAFLPGILALVAYGSGVAPGFSVIFELRAGVVERLRVTPVSRLAILAGPVLATATQMLLFNAVLVAVGAAFGFRARWLDLALAAVPLAMLEVATAAFFVAFALLAREINSFAAVVNGLNLPVLLLGGVLLPVSLGPLWLQVLARFDPLYYTVDAARTLAAGGTGGWTVYAVLVPLCLLALVWATRVLRRATA